MSCSAFHACPLPPRMQEKARPRVIKLIDGQPLGWPPAVHALDNYQTTDLPDSVNRFVDNHFENLALAFMTFLPYSEQWGLAYMPVLYRVTPEQPLPPLSMAFLR